MIIAWNKRRKISTNLVVNDKIMRERREIQTGEALVKIKDFSLTSGSVENEDWNYSILTCAARLGGDCWDRAKLEMYHTDKVKGAVFLTRDFKFIWLSGIDQERFVKFEPEDEA